MLSEPKPFEEAVASIRGRRRLPTALGHADLQRLGPALRRRALILARVTEVEILDKVDRSLKRLVSGVSTGAGDYTNPTKIRAELKELISGLDYQPEPDRVGTISDLRTDARLNLIIDTERKMASGRGQYIQANDPDSLAIFPCQELVRVESREVPRGYERRKGAIVAREPDYWPKRWQAAGGEIFEGRMIARIDDPVWTKLSRFGLPHPPFDFNSGMGTRLVKRSEALRLGVIEKGEVVAPSVESDFAEVQAMPAPDVGSQFLSALEQIGFSVRDGLLGLA